MQLHNLLLIIWGAEQKRTGFYKLLLADVTNRLNSHSSLLLNGKETPIVGPRAEPAEEVEVSLVFVPVEAHDVAAAARLGG